MIFDTDIKAPPHCINRSKADLNWDAVLVVLPVEMGFCKVTLQQSQTTSVVLHYVVE